MGGIREREEMQRVDTEGTVKDTIWDYLVIVGIVEKCIDYWNSI